MRSVDAVIIGGGHNALVASAYLARTGRKVLVLERREMLGGAAITEEIVPNFRFSRASYVYSLFRPHIVRDLDLHSHGLRLLPRQPSSFTPTPSAGGPSLILGGGLDADTAAIARFSKRDAAAWGPYNAMLDRYSACFLPLLDRPPPDISALLDPHTPWRARLAAGRDALRAGASVAALGRELLPFLEFLTAPATKTLDAHFESEILKATLATDAIIGAMAPPSAPQTSYVLLHHVMCGAWANVQGGMGALSGAIAAAARQAGAELRVSSPVKRILVQPSTASRSSRTNPAAASAPSPSEVTGVELADGSVIRAPVVLSTTAPRITFLDLLADAQVALPPGFAAHIRGADVNSGSVKINIALDKLPSFLCAPNPPGGPPPAHLRGTIHFETSVSTIEDAFRDASAGRPSRRPVIEMTLPTVLDSTIAPPGKHIALLFVQYAPYTLRPVINPSTGAEETPSWADPAVRASFVDSVLAVIEEHAPGFKASIIGMDVLMPPDLERIFALPGGNIFHASMGLDQLFWLRPAPGYARYASPISGLYVGGAGTHPGGGVMGAPGHNSAQRIISDRGWRA